MIDFEVDYPEVCTRKRDIIAKNKALYQLLHKKSDCSNSSDVSNIKSTSADLQSNDSKKFESDEILFVKSDNYALLHADIRKPQVLEANLKHAGLDTSYYIYLFSITIV